jgi:hypothetical protein
MVGVVTLGAHTNFPQYHYAIFGLMCQVVFKSSKLIAATLLCYWIPLGPVPSNGRVTFDRAFANTVFADKSRSSRPAVS